MFCHFILGHSVVCLNKLKNVALINHINITFSLIFANVLISPLYIIIYIPVNYRRYKFSPLFTQDDRKNPAVTMWCPSQCTLEYGHEATAPPIYGIFYSRLYPPSVLFPATLCSFTPSPLPTFRN